jgi:hypothetical protein
MQAKTIYLKIKREITRGLYAYDDQIAAIAKWVESEFEEKKQGQILPIDNVSKQRELLIDFLDYVLMCQDEGANIVDRDKYVDGYLGN